MENIGNLNLCKYVNRIRLNLFHFGYARVGTEWRGRVMSPDYSRLYYITGGISYITTDDNTCTALMPGMWYLLPSGCSFSYKCENHMEHIYFHLKFCDFDENDLLRNCISPLKFDSQDDKSEVLKDYLSSINIVDGLMMRQIVYNVLLSIIEKNAIVIKSKDYSPCIFKALQYIKQNLSVQLSLSEIAENTFVSKSTLTKHFKKELSMSVNEYIYNIIMFQAERMLTTSDLPILAISEKLGFSDQFYFSKRFKSKFGKAPSEYRKSPIF